MVHVKVGFDRLFYSIAVLSFLFFFFFNDTATTEIYTLSLHDALPISKQVGSGTVIKLRGGPTFEQASHAEFTINIMGWH